MIGHAEKMKDEMGRDADLVANWRQLAQKLYSL
jgi:hypothetical protein